MWAGTPSSLSGGTGHTRKTNSMIWGQGFVSCLEEGSLEPEVSHVSCYACAMEPRKNLWTEAQVTLLLSNTSRLSSHVFTGE